MNQQMTMVLAKATVVAALLLASCEKPTHVRETLAHDNNAEGEISKRSCGENTEEKKVAAIKEDGPPSLALLVGCTKYVNHPDLRELYGPANDVPLWAKLLTDTKGFAFPDENVIQLVGWPADESKRPTFANIVKGFGSLIDKAQPNSRVFILLSGHGVQVPIPETQKDPLDPKNPEPDGLDEVFLPADVGEWKSRVGLKNGLLDDQIGEFLDKLRAKGAHVLIVFDCCHSGTKTRGSDPAKEGNREIIRAADERVLGVTEKEKETAVRRAAEAIEQAKKEGKPIPGDAIVMQSADAKGSLVAFYAAASYEEAPELPMPDGAPILRENYYGMLTWTMVEVIQARKSLLTYAQLHRLVWTNYRTSRGIQPPTPFAEGDLSREVLGMKTWPKRQEIDIQR